jgi:hypothetical protein
MKSSRRNIHLSGVGVEGVAESEDRPGSSVQKDRNIFQPGDIVEILSLPEVRETLDENGCCEGLGFMEPMERYCGRRSRIVKKVRMIFDERRWRTVRLKNVYLLENIVCNGRGVFHGEGCDRMCYFFWKDAWLKKVDGL